MNRPPIRLGPLAILLLVISTALTTMAILTYSTSKADLVLAQRFADSVRIRYQLDEQGCRIMQQLEEDPQSAAAIGFEYNEGKYEYHSSLEGYTLTIVIDESGQLVSNRIHKDWSPEDDYNLWPGE